MTAFSTFLDHLSTAEWLFIAAASWCVLAALAAPRLGRAMRDDNDVVVRLVNQYPPPVPAPSDASWLSAWPTNVERADIDTLEQRVYDRLFDDLIAIEGLS